MHALTEVSVCTGSPIPNLLGLLRYFYMNMLAKNHLYVCPVWSERHLLYNMHTSRSLVNCTFFQIATYLAVPKPCTIKKWYQRHTTRQRKQERNGKHEFRSSFKDIRTVCDLKFDTTLRRQKILVASETIVLVGHV